MKTTKRIKVINSNPAGEGITLQDDINEYIGKEFEVIEWWKNRNSGLEEGEIQVVLRSESDPNPKGQLSILNKNEYEFI